MPAARTRLIRRFAAERVVAALRDTPIVLVNGPRQCGKTTLVQELIDAKRTYVTLDDDTALAAASGDPAGFVGGLDSATIDEVQRAPSLFPAIKRAVDSDRRPGRFLLAGSANILVLPRVSESLAGRMETVTLLPLSRAEIRGTRPNFLHSAFAGKMAPPAEKLPGQGLVRAALTGGYPEMVRREDPRRRQSWARAYIAAIVRRDVRDIANVEQLDHMPRLLRALALHSGQLANYTQIGGQLGLDDKTTRKYVGILEQLFLVHRLEPWFHNRLKRLIKSPKLHFHDAGLLAALAGATEDRIAKDRALLGPLLESFVVSEVLKQTTWSGEDYSLYHYRDKDQDEVDLVIENAAGEIIGLEVKAAATATDADFKGLRKLAAAAGANFRLGAVVYAGETVIPFGDGMFAAPFPCLWA